jgi:hypothetical protein
LEIASFTSFGNCGSFFVWLPPNTLIIDSRVDAALGELAVWKAWVEKTNKRSANVNSIGVMLRA